MDSIFLGAIIGAAVALIAAVPVAIRIHSRRMAEIRRKEALIRAELGENIVRLNLLLENSSAATFIFRGTCFLALNRATEGLTGYSREELLAMRGLSTSTRIIARPQWRGRSPGPEGSLCRLSTRSSC